MKILVPLDGSDFAEAVLEPLAEFAAANDAELHLVQALIESDAKATMTETTRADHHLAAERGVTGAFGGVIHGVEPRVPAETQSQAQDRLR